MPDDPRRESYYPNIEAGYCECVDNQETKHLTLFTPAYFGISGTGGGHIVPPLSILGLGGVRVPILFGNNLPMND